MKVHERRLHVRLRDAHGKRIHRMKDVMHEPLAARAARHGVVDHELEADAPACTWTRFYKLDAKVDVRLRAINRRDGALIV